MSRSPAMVALSAMCTCRNRCTRAVRLRPTRAMSVTIRLPSAMVSSRPMLPLTSALLPKIVTLRSYTSALWYRNLLYCHAHANSCSAASSNRSQGDAGRFAGSFQQSAWFQPAALEHDPVYCGEWESRFEIIVAWNSFLSLVWRRPPMP
jgi:hypothetical protein